MGAVGSRGYIIRLLNNNTHIIKIDPITEEPLKDKDGFCVKVTLLIYKKRYRYYKLKI
jgi:hypothetical protein